MLTLCDVTHDTNVVMHGEVQRLPKSC